jgi:pimeloyl-ACP methyl ester carboxylesterase
MSNFTETQELIVLLHGLWMNGLCLQPLAKRLRAQGYQTFCFNYRSRQDNSTDIVSQLHYRIADLKVGTIHFVAHSLGGLLVQHLLARYPEQRPGRVVALGTPFAGSHIAQQFYLYGVGRYLLGRSIEENLLLKKTPPWQFPQELGVIAGSRNFGMGHLLAHLPSPHDGTVSVRETTLPGMTDHCVIPNSHSGLVFSPLAAHLTGTFLRYGQFKKPPA